MEDLHPPELRALAQETVERLRRRLEEGSPSLSVHVMEWMRRLAGDAPPERYFLHPHAFPMLLLPWWLEESIRGTASREFQGDVVYSTISGYYFIRLIDDLMDGEEAPDPRVLPALIVLHTEFEQAYHPHFASGHPFWETLATASYAAAETASKDAGLEDIGRDDFLETSARKIAGAVVPIAAVAQRYGRPDLLGPWSDFVALFGRWHQMLNDVHGWSRDSARGRRTWFLCEAERRSPGSAVEWVLGDGLAWGMAEMETWMDELLVSAALLDCPPLTVYLGERRRMLALAWQEISESLVPLRRIASTLG
jgi:hypothetical protein